MPLISRETEGERDVCSTFLCRGKRSARLRSASACSSPLASVPEGAPGAASVASDSVTEELEHRCWRQAEVTFIRKA